MSVWDDLIGQKAAVETLRRAVAGESHAMSHAWLITGPPGSGRSNTAKAFAAALQCAFGDGCGTCSGCRTALSGAHPDVTLVRTEKLSISIAEIRDLVRKAHMHPTLGQRQILIIEDADRITEQGTNALLKAIEEPAPSTIWLLCAPTPEDVIVTIRSRCRKLHLAAPSQEAVAQLLQRRDGVPETIAHFAARVSQGHVGRARLLATNEDARIQRHNIVSLPPTLTSLGACLQAAEQVVNSAKTQADQIAGKLEYAEWADFEQTYGMGTKGVKVKPPATAKKELADQQKARRTRLERDAIDQALTELVTYYRDVLSIQLNAQNMPLINAELAPQIQQLAHQSSAIQTLRHIDAILDCRKALFSNVQQLLAAEAMFISLMQ